MSYEPCPGTADMLARAELAKIRVIRVEARKKAPAA